ncbi:MAG: PorV/PorQ family protein [Endomicrobiales bacterium]
MNQLKNLYQSNHRKALAGAGAAAMLLLQALFAPVDCGAAFKDSGWGVRPLGMGGAFTAVVNDANAPAFNPSGVAQIAQHEFSLMSARLFSGLEGVDIGLNYFGYVMPVSESAGNFGFTWTSLSSPDLYREDTGSIAYGRTLDDLFQIGGMNLFVGAGIKYVRHEYNLDVRTTNDPVFSKGQVAGAFTGDAGLLVLLPEAGLSLGLASKNISSPDVGLKTSDPVYNENVLGLAYYNESLPVLGLPYFTAAFDLVSRNREMDYRAGAETWLFDGKFAVRAGGRAQELTLGFGYEIKVLGESKLILDYALAWPLEMEKTSGSHRFSLTLRLP